MHETGNSKRKIKMTKITKENLKAYADELAQLHDEIKLKIHLGAKEAQDEWHEIEEKWKKFVSDAKSSEQKLESFAKDAELSESGKDIISALELVGSELKTAYQRIRKAL